MVDDTNIRPIDRYSRYHPPRARVRTRFRVAPQPVDPDWAKGVFPTVRGDIPVSWRRERGALKLEEAPAATTAEMVLPERAGGWASVEVDKLGNVLSDALSRSRAGVLEMERTETGLKLVVAGPRKISLTARP